MLTQHFGNWYNRWRELGADLSDLSSTIPFSSRIRTAGHGQAACREPLRTDKPSAAVVY